MILLRILAALALLVPAAVQAQDSDGEIWVSGWATGKVSGKLLASVDVSLRADDKGTRSPTLLLRPLIGVAVTKRLSLWGGYTYVATYPDAGPNATGVTAEHRAVGQILWNPPLPGRSALVARTRIEARFVEGQAGTGYRLREMLRYTHPISRGKTLIVLQSEPFVALNDTAFGQAGGMDQIRNFVGVNVPVGKGLSTDLGYMNRYIWRRTGNDRMDHIAATMLIYRF
ncbi:DUF2490 domain-containing protein [Sphingomonas immobilis]|uniref:DUF2490 domain-containing protein n=1 Tax=Sphingomonas immobilis TaxID=3063997 RepID=A0ABT8ZXL3_9SPHN|nr:DUF2490 domain-containing protein [Sphingomonas sp. CA1-15]MDO7841521.1 DUF2490 domain-containing protein [Sphingomonas sp. CA1-15]